MTKKRKLFYWFIFFANFAVSQSLELSVQNMDSLLIDDYSVYVNSHYSGKSKGYFHEIYPKLFDTIVVEKNGVYSDPLIVKDEKLNNYRFTLFSNINQIEEIIVVNKKYSEIAGRKNEHIIDYLSIPEDETIILLKLIKNNYYIEKQSYDDTIEVKLSINPIQLFRDIFGNSHLITKDTAYQIWFQNEFSIVAKISRKLFDLKIAPLVLKTENAVFYENFINNNKCYILSKTNSENTLTTIIKVTDKIGHKVANSEYRTILATYNNEIPIERNLIKNGLWEGDLVQLAETNELTIMITWYLNISAKKIPCASYALFDKIITVDLFNNIIYKIDFKGNTIKKTPLKNENNNNEKLIHDFLFDAIYLLKSNKNNLQLSRIDVENGELLVVGIIEKNNIENIKVYGESIFFLQKNEFGFAKLFKMKMIK